MMIASVAVEEVTAAEDRIREAVAGGEPLLVVRERLRYHDLQSRQRAGET